MFKFEPFENKQLPKSIEQDLGNIVENFKKKLPEHLHYSPETLIDKDA